MGVVSSSEDGEFGIANRIHGLYRVRPLLFNDTNYLYFWVSREQQNTSR